ncbi:MAG: SCP2 sterol-binding domain-containing protein [Porticoccus sp.]|nr:SCP2 sterol-binding domain-containing protein [Porticoccus sp.]MBQ0806384.1 SCP2 sterol-binding domain-containing protein [Porticoccus sp.]
MGKKSPVTTTLSVQLLHRIEPILFSALRLAPFSPQKFLLERLLKQFLLEPIAEGDLEFLTDRVLKISVEDVGIGWRLSYKNNQLIIQPLNGPSDATISGNARAFILLASRQEDPDTLFFRRELSIEGDTELGLEVKNLLDSVELDALPSVLQKTLSGAGKLATAI